jgi:hypothetical protein
MTWIGVSMVFLVLLEPPWHHQATDHAILRRQAGIDRSRSTPTERPDQTPQEVGGELMTS